MNPNKMKIGRMRTPTTKQKETGDENMTEKNS